MSGACVCHSISVQVRRDGWSGFCPSTFTWFPGIRLRSPGHNSTCLHPLNCLAPLSSSLSTFSKTDTLLWGSSCQPYHVCVPSDFTPSTVSPSVVMWSQSLPLSWWWKVSSVKSLGQANPWLESELHCNKASDPAVLRTLMLP